jgi:hypothetical protein
MCCKSGRELEAGRLGVDVEYCYTGHILIGNGKTCIIHSLLTN